MRTYSIIDYPQKLREYFSFLTTEYHYDLVEDKELRLGYSTIYLKDEIKIHLYYDYMDNLYYFELIRGKETKYPNDCDFENIKPFFRFVEKYEPNFDFKKLQPDDNQYLEALELNARLLRKYGNKVLKGEEWI